MDQQSQQREHYIQKLVSTARSIIANEVALPLGVLKMTKNITWVNNIQPLDNINFDVIKMYDCNVDDLPIGSERLHWDIEKLIEFEEQFDQTNKLFRADVLRKCKEIIDKYGITNSYEESGT